MEAVFPRGVALTTGAAIERFRRRLSLLGERGPRGACRDASPQIMNDTRPTAGPSVLPSPRGQERPSGRGPGLWVWRSDSVCAPLEGGMQLPRDAPVAAAEAGPASQSGLRPQGWGPSDDAPAGA